MTSKVTIESHNGNGKGIDIVVTELGPEGVTLKTHSYHAEDNLPFEVTIWHGKEITSIKEVE